MVVDYEVAIEECRTPTLSSNHHASSGEAGAAAATFRLSAYETAFQCHSQVSFLTTSAEEAEQEEEVDNKPSTQHEEIEKEGETWSGYSIKCLPNGMRSLPSPASLRWRWRG